MWDINIIEEKVLNSLAHVKELRIFYMFTILCPGVSF